MGEELKALDLSNLMRHAFAAGFEVVGGDSDTFDQWWPDYNPEECPAFERIKAALAERATLTAERDRLRDERDAFLEEARKTAEERDRLREALEKIACRHVTDKPLWWQLEARAALNASSEVLCEDEGCPHHGTPHVCVAPSETSAKPEPDVWLYRYRPIGSQYWSDWKVGTIRRDLGVKGLESEERGLYAHPPAPSETGRVSDAAQFLLDRLSEVEPSEEMARDWLGHVEPAIARLRASLNGGRDGAS